MSPPTTGFPVPLAHWSQRALAALIDVAPVAAFALWNRSWPAVAVAIAYLWWVGVIDGLTGQSPGKALLGLRLVDQRGTVVGRRMGVGRKFLHVLDLLPLGLGFLLPLVDVRRQTLADRMLSTFVVSGARPRRMSVALWVPPRSH